MQERRLLQHLDPGIIIDPDTGRGTVDGYQVVDFGLPSGLLWATVNVGATSLTNIGNYYMYGKGTRTYHSSDSSYTGTESPLDPAKDTATQKMGKNWRTPTQADFQELDRYVTKTIYQNNVKYTSKANSNIYMYLPVNGYYNEGGSLVDKNSNTKYANYWISDGGILYSGQYYAPTIRILCSSSAVISTSFVNKPYTCGLCVRGVYSPS